MTAASNFALVWVVVVVVLVLQQQYLPPVFLSSSRLYCQGFALTATTTSRLQSRLSNQQQTLSSSSSSSRSWGKAFPKQQRQQQQQQQQQQQLQQQQQQQLEKGHTENAASPFLSISSSLSSSCTNPGLQVAIRADDGHYGKQRSVSSSSSVSSQQTDATRRTRPTTTRGPWRDVVVVGVGWRWHALRDSAAQQVQQRLHQRGGRQRRQDARWTTSSAIPTTARTTARTTTTTTLFLARSSFDDNDDDDDDDDNTIQQTSTSFDNSNNNNNNNEEQERREWKAIQAALTVYQAAYGDLLVPQRFVVPNLSPWPKSAWGMRLGKIVQAMRVTRNNNKYVTSPQRRAWLEQAGFVWQLPSSAPKTNTNQSSSSLPSPPTTLPTTDREGRGRLVKKAKLLKKAKKAIIKAKEGAQPSQLQQPLSTDQPERLPSRSEPRKVVAASQRIAAAAPVNNRIQSGSHDNEDDDDDYVNDDDDDDAEFARPDVNERRRQDWSVQKIYTALLVYAQCHQGSTNVPLDFVVPTETTASFRRRRRQQQQGEVQEQEWPTSVQGLPLGRELKALLANQGAKLFASQEHEYRSKLINLLQMPKPKSTSSSSSSFDSSSNAEARSAKRTQSSQREQINRDNDDDDEDDETNSDDSNDRMNKQEKQRQEEFTSSPSSTSTTMPSVLTMITNDGGVPSANDIRFEKVYRALAKYKEIHGDLLVPQPFVVPKSDPDWQDDPDLWGLRLGARVNAIRSQGTFVNKNPERRQILDDLGFVWNPPRTESRRAGQQPPKASTSISNNKRQRGQDDDDEEDEDGDFDDDDDSQDEDDDDDEISSLFGKSFGFLEGDDNDDVDDDDNEGRSSSSSKERQATWGFEGGGDLQELALLQQKQMEERQHREEVTYAPPRTLAESLADARVRAQEVGIIEAGDGRIRKGKREKEIPWFNDDFGDDFVFEDVLEALSLYKSFHGNFANLTVNYDFIVPPPSSSLRTGFLDEDEDDLIMSNFYKNMNGDDDYDDDEDDDDDMGGIMKRPSAFSRTFDTDASARAARAIARFEEQGDFDQSQDLIAAEIQRLQQLDGLEAGTATQVRDPISSRRRDASMKKGEWPEHLAGMQLGNIVSRIQDGSLEVRHLEERKSKLDALGFDWGDDRYFLDIAFEKAMCAFYAYYLVRGDMFVYEDFVMPNEDPWPEALAGYEIGKAVKRIRELQNFLEAYHPEKVSLLRMIDFVWFPVMALPLDPGDELEMDNELLRLTGLGHPDYAIRDIPMGIQEQILADGPFFDTGGDPKLWWREWHNWDYVKDYWYEQGRRDNALVLRKMGYPKMAAEHEAKYGPGLFETMEWTLSPLRDENAIKSKTVEELKDLLKTLSYFRLETQNCTDIQRDDRQVLLEELDELIIEVMKAAGIPWDDEKDNQDTSNSNDKKDTSSKTSSKKRKSKKRKEEEEEEEEEEEDYEPTLKEEDDEDESLFITEEDYDVDGELGLQSIR